MVRWWRVPARVALVVLPLLSLGLADQALAQSCSIQGAERGYDPVPNGYQALTIAGTAVGLDASMITTGTAALAFATLETAGISISDVVTPTTAIGHQLAAGSQFYICGRQSLLAFKAIALAGTATLKVSYYKVRQ